METPYICNACIENRHYACGSKRCTCTHPRGKGSVNSSASGRAPGEVVKTPISGFIAGGVSGIIMGVLMILAGSFLCMTVIGAILGIPLILGGLMAPFGLAVTGSKSFEGDCPVCGTLQTSTAKGFDCRTCKKRLVLKEGKFVVIA